MDKQLPQRKTIRLKHYDYAWAGAYFITICAAEKQCIFGRIIGEEMQLNKLGVVVEACWREIPEHFRSVELDEYIIMPNHLHGIILLHEENICRGAACSARDSSRGVASNARDSVACNTHPETPIMQPGTLSTIVRSFKSAATKIAREQNLIGPNPLWQRNFFERIIRNDEALAKAREYTITNPLRWHFDKENPDRISTK